MSRVYVVQVNDVPEGYAPNYFPRTFHYKSEAVECAKQVVKQGATMARIVNNRDSTELVCAPPKTKPTPPPKTPTFTDENFIEGFTAFLEETLIPDLKASRKVETADDFEKALEIIRELRSPDGVQQSACLLLPKERRNLIKVLKRTLG